MHELIIELDFILGQFMVMSIHFINQLAIELENFLKLLSQ